MSMLTNNLGYPRIGPNRELKKALEAYWKRLIPKEELLQTAKNIRRANWQVQKDACIDLIPSNDFTLYDHVLDTICLFGALPERYIGESNQNDFDTYFEAARGGRQKPMEMTKWFDTNYHYIVPEFVAGQTFHLGSRKVFDEFIEARAIGIETKPVLLGPLSFLLLGKMKDGGDALSLLPALVEIYCEIISELKGLGCEWIQLDEPMLVTDLGDETRAAYSSAYATINERCPDINIIVATYFGSPGQNLGRLLGLPVKAVHIDFTRTDNPQEIFEVFPDNMLLSLGLVNGRNIWKNDLDWSSSLINTAKAKLGDHRLIVAPSCSLLHVPVSTSQETELDPELLSWMSFAEEKLKEVVDLRRIAEDDTIAKELLAANAARLQSMKQSPARNVANVAERISSVLSIDVKRNSPVEVRRILQQKVLNLPFFPTTTIGSFPQTAEIRAARAKHRKGEITAEEYEQFIKDKTAEVIKLQEDLGIDVLVHGEFERNDMVEYFGEQLSGYCFTKKGWVQSYGSRCVKPPIIYGDVERPNPMTVQWSKLAQSFTDRPMKGMLTGPVTILKWSFVRDDQPLSTTAFQIALAISDEVHDLERAGIKVIQIDEPALREGMPLKRTGWDEYLEWATKAFRISSACLSDETQIHTHMCYAEFNEIIRAIAELDADVISIEASRSEMELLDAFSTFEYPSQIGPGVWDIHSPRVPSTAEMIDLLEKALALIPAKNIWVNPDCGLKTRDWPETLKSLNNMVLATKTIREKYNGS